MSDPNKHNAPSANSAIQRYLKGEMSAREMHELEKAALEDPFLADALEGFESHPTQPHLDELHTRLEERVSQPERKTVPFFRSAALRVAAAVILLIGLGYTAWYVLPGEGKSKIAVAKQEATPSANEPVADTITKAAAADKADSVAVAPPSTASQVAAARKIPARSAPAEPYKINRDTTALNQPVTTAPVVAKAEESYNSALYKENPILLSGKVLDANNNPLPGASLHLTTDKNISTVTDEWGHFNLKVYPGAPRRDSLLQVTVDLVGYQRSDLVLNTFDHAASIGNIIHLQPQNSSLDEVVVIRDNKRGMRSKEFLAAAPSISYEKLDSAWETVSPVIGKYPYLAYLDAGKKTLTKDSTVRGTVIISFDVSKKGDLTSFKVEQSLTPATDAGLIQLVSEGPAWRVKKGRSARAAVSLVF